ncbi:MAG: hypothetical protein A4E65_03115 [Syntrophorhabdus sp. PtaU1.Bin153]|nr:MAG: hypothetical protein A4E65_03115 [Syntrophorhabdus sp. PtaU1.Bin153]
MTGQAGSLASERNGRRNAIFAQVCTPLWEAPRTYVRGGDDVSPGNCMIAYHGYSEVILMNAPSPAAYWGWVTRTGAL